MQQRTGEDVVREVLQRLAPHELRTVQAALREYATDPYPPEPAGGTGGGVLGNGVEGLLLLPVLLPVVTQVLADLAVGALRQGGGALTRWVRRRRRRREGAQGRAATLTSPLPDLSAFPPQELARWAAEYFRDCRVPRAEAEAYARVLVVVLTAATSGEAVSPGPLPPVPAGSPASTATAGRSGAAAGSNASASASADEPLAVTAASASAAAPAPDAPAPAPVAREPAPTNPTATPTATPGVPPDAPDVPPDQPAPDEPDEPTAHAS